MIDPHLSYRLLGGDANPAAGSVAGLMAAESIVILVSDKDTIVVAESDPSSDGAGMPGGESAARFPTVGEAGPAAGVIAGCREGHQIAVWKERPVYALAVGPEDLDLVDGNGPLKRENYRGLYLRISDVELELLGRAIQIVDWYATSRYCSACGQHTVIKADESVARCPACGHDQYPRLAPAMIVAVVRDGKLLLARAPRFRGAFHSVLAGFVEPGESVEQCIHREVFEETRIRVKNVRSFGSQSWPFPHSLMLGFTAEWAGGEIEIDGVELEHADWFAPDAMPPVPTELSISGRLINWFRSTYG